MTTPTIGDQLRQLAAKLIDVGDPHVSIQIQPEENGDVHTVDAIAKAVGVEVQDVRLSGGSWHRTGRTQLGRFSISVFTGIEEPPEDKRERLRAELAALDAQIETDSEVTR